jgi:RsiW-degrading membrane proteinase PrsW (M82 family)
LISASIIVFALIIWADQYENEKKLHLFWAFLWGGIVATTASFLTFTWLEFINNNIFLAATAEEFFKFIGLYVAYKKLYISWWTDGLVFGSMIGLGFTFFEDIDYIASSTTPLDTAFFRALVSVFAHSFFTGVFGALFIASLINKRKLFAGFSFFLASISHFLWNSPEFLAESIWVFIVLPPFALMSLAFYLRYSEKAVIKKSIEDISGENLLTYPEQIYFDLAARRKFIRLESNRSQRKFIKRLISQEIHQLLLDKSRA